METILGIAIGLAAGFLGGMFGIGGGLIMVPAMVFLMGFTQHKAQGTSLAVLMVPVGILGALNYFKAGNVDVKLAVLIAVGFVGGSFLGSKLVLGLPETSVKKIFAIFLALVAIYTWIRAVPPAQNPAPVSEASESASQ